MTEDALQQVITTLKAAKSIALLLPAEPSLDATASAYALLAIIEKVGGQAIVVSSSTNIPKLPFLNRTISILPSLAVGDQFAVKISTARAKPGELRYEIEPDGVVVYLKAKEGEFTPADVSVSPAIKKIEALISLGVSSLDQLGQVYTDNASVFFETPIINIDNNPGNEYFGTINLVNVKASSISETVFDIAAAIPAAASDDTVTTGLLAGIIQQTQSFRDARTTPTTLSKASRLISSGARQQDVVQYLFKTKPFATLQLWGRAMARLIAVPETSLLYTAVTKSDLEKTDPNPGALVDVLRDLVGMISDFSVIALAAELPEGVKVLAAGLPHIKTGEVLQKMGASAGPVHHLVGNYEFAEALFPDKNLSDIQNLLVRALPAQ